MPSIKDIAAQLSAEAKADAEAIEAIAKKAVADIQAVLDKYKDVPADISLPALSQGRNALANLNMHFPEQMPRPPMPMPILPA